MAKIKSLKNRRPTKRERSRPGTRTLEIDDADTRQIVRLVRGGFSFSRLAKLEKATGLSRETLARFVSIPTRTLSRRQKEGRLQPDESDRVLRASRIFDLASDLFEGDAQAARKWLQTPQAGLGGEVPLDFAATDIGAREVESLIGRLEYGVLS